MALSTFFLSAVQRRIVESPPSAGHILLVAGPGSGKTRTIVARIAWLIESGVCAPEHVLATTFTQKAAEELRDRLGDLGHGGVLTGTFHHVCARLLDRYADGVGARKPDRVYDEGQQVAVIEQAAAELGLVFDRSGAFTARGVRNAISMRKRSGLEPGVPHPTWQPVAHADVLAAIDARYCDVLRQRGAFDFDDVILEGLRLLAIDEVAESIQRRFHFMFVDEFQDVSGEQYDLIRRLRPPLPVDDGQFAGVLAVADPNQSIFEWRDARPKQMLARFERDYRPKRHQLHENHRSTDTIVTAANFLLGDPAARQMPVRTDAGLRPACIACADETAEIAALSRLVAKAVEAGKTFDDIAILYRLHDRGDAAEQALIQADIPVRRIQRDRFFNQPDAQDALRLLDLVTTMSDPCFVPALNWPRVVVDELTMIHLRRLAAKRGMALAEVAQRIDEFAGDVSPLSRVAIAEFVHGIAEELAPLGDKPVDQIVERMLALLDRRRSAINAADRETLRGALDFVARPLREAVERAYVAVADARPIAARYMPGLDAAAGAAILETVFRRYLGVAIDVAPASDPVTPGAFVITIGDQPVSDNEGIGITARTTRSLSYGLALQAWRFGQMLLMRYEHLHTGTFAVCDIETTSLHWNTTELVEVAAVYVAGGRLTGAELSSLVRPSSEHAITHDAEATHGIGWSKVHDAPPADEVLPALLSFLGDHVVVGHNFDGFDGRVIARLARESGLPAPAYATLDTVHLARRLLPGESHRLEDLARRFDIPAGGLNHRALPDARRTAHVLIELLALMRSEQELDALGEALPLVALGTIGSGFAIGDETAILTDAGARGAALGHGRQLLDRCRELLQQDALFDAMLLKLRPRSQPHPEEAERWQQFSERWRQIAAQFVRASDDPGLREFLRTVALTTEIDAGVEWASARPANDAALRQRQGMAGGDPARARGGITAAGALRRRRRHRRRAEAVLRRDDASAGPALSDVDQEDGDEDEPTFAISGRARSGVFRDISARNPARFEPCRAGKLSATPRRVKVVPLSEHVAAGALDRCLRRTAQADVGQDQIAALRIERVGAPVVLVGLERKPGHREGAVRIDAQLLHRHLGHDHGGHEC